MDDYSTPSGSASDDAFTNRWGCAILILATVLFAVQRVVLLAFLSSAASNGNALGTEALQFLFGSPPYSIIDTLLGFEIPDQGLFFLLQPHNLLLGLAQAVHFGINLGIVYAFFWVIETFRSATASRPWLRFGTCVVFLALAAVAGFGAAGLCGSGVSLSALAPADNSCTGPRAVAWAVATGDRLSESDSDLNVMEGASSPSTFYFLASKAKKRYEAQEMQDTPTCLAGVQSQISEAFFYEWKAFEAGSVSNFELGAAYGHKADDAIWAMKREIGKLAAQYGWDVGD